jgi:hypothetical protein
MILAFYRKVEKTQNSKYGKEKIKRKSNQYYSRSTEPAIKPPASEKRTI